jgi:hypothetical protein
MFVEYQAYFPPNTRALCAFVGHRYNSCPIKYWKPLLLPHDSGIFYIMRCGNSYSGIFSTSYNYTFLSS